MKDNKKIAVNTMLLYVKFIVTTAISLVMSRLVLQALGVSDYGLYSVVGGVVAMLNTLGASMVATSYRYMAVEIGKGKNGNPNRIYNTVVIIHIAIALLLLIIGETLGVFYVNNYLNVDSAKTSDALFIFHVSLFTTAFSVITIPMNGLIIAREKFLFTSIVEIMSAIAKIASAFFLINYDGNRLCLYAIMLAVIQLTVPLLYQIYCRIKDAAIIKWSFNHNIADYKELFEFACWMLLGSMAIIGKIQGVAIIVNFFFGTILNAAFGLASQVSSAVNNFTSTLRQAAIPQIMKSQGNGDEERSLTLVYAMSRYSYLCMNILVIPLLLCMEDILKIWLGTPPEYTQIFVNFLLVSGMISNLGAGFDASIQATGKIRKNQIGYSIINLSIFPLVFVLYKIGLPVYVNVICMVFLSIATLVFQVHIMTELTLFSINYYIKQTIVPSFLSTLVAFLPLCLVRLVWPYSPVATILFLVISIIWTCVAIVMTGLARGEKQLLLRFLQNRIFK